MAEALGYIFLSSSGNRLNPIGSNLIHIDSIRTQSAHPLLQQTAITVLHDVRNPLFGEQGAAFVYAPQKGANPQQVSLLDQGLEHLAGIISGRFQVDINFPGAGAAGGLGAGAKFFLKAELRSGIDFVMDFVRLEDHIRSVDLVITGEGKIDQQTFSGKVVAGVARLASRHRKKCVAFAGVSEVSSTQYKRIGLSEIVTTTDIGISNQYSMENAFPLLKEAGRKYFSPPSVTH
jgi:glycerate kinase